MSLGIQHIEILLLIAAIVSMLVRRLRLPYTVGLVVAGVGVALLPGELEHVSLTKEMIFTAFLPPLIFEAAYQMTWPLIRRDLPVTLLLATLGVVVCTLLIGAGAHLLLAWPWIPALICGALLSATDPVSVIATFRETKVDERLRMLVEAESLFNDGTAAVLFTVLLATLGGSAMTVGTTAESFLSIVLGGIACGAMLGGAVLLISGRTVDHLVEITFTTVAAYGSFLLAEHFHFSGVLATLTAGVLIGNVGPLGPISPRGREAVESFWEYVGFAANSLIFLLIGMALTRQRFMSHLSAISVVIVLSTVGRALAVYGCCGLFHRTRAAVKRADQHVLFWGGLRGALSLALALSLPADMPQREAIRTVVFATVAFTILVQGLTLIPLLRRLRITGAAIAEEERLPI